MKSSPRIGTLLSLAGVVLIIVGFFLPMFNESNPQVPGSIHPVYEWQAINVFLIPTLMVLFALLAALPLLGLLIVLIANGAELFGVSLPNSVLLKRVGAGCGLIFQLLFDVLLFSISGIGYGRVDIGAGLVVMLVGFMLVCIDAFPIAALQSHKQVSHS